MNDYSYNQAVKLAKTHKRLYHYTTFENLTKIISNKSILLNRIDRLNDTIENDRMLNLWQNKVYVSCFTHRDYESYFFWKAYTGGKSNGVMISFDNTYLFNLTVHPDEKCELPSLNKCIESNIDAVYSSKISSNFWGIYDYSVVDVMYVPRNFTTPDYEYFQGRFKFLEWDLEFETRLRVAIRPKCLEFKSVKTELKYLQPDNQCVFAKLPESCMESMSITLSPFSNEDQFEKVNNFLKHYGLSEKIKVNHSSLYHEVRN